MNINPISITSPRPIRSDYHVIPSGTGWSVRKEHNVEIEYRGMTQLEAFAYAVEMARIDNVSAILHGRDGRIRDVRSYDDVYVIGPCVPS